MVRAYNAKQWEVRAILDGRKSCIRIAVKYKYSNTEMKIKSDKYGSRLIEIQKDVEGETYGKNPDGNTWHRLLPYIEKIPPYQPDDIMYVRETFVQPATHIFWYRADNAEYTKNILWRPSIQMPREAARIWLKVTDVRVERLQEITSEQIGREGVEVEYPHVLNGEEKRYAFSTLWNSTIKKSDLERYGWDASPWVWVIEFERCEPPEDE